MAQFTLTVNGKSRTVEAGADTPLLWVLRDLLDLPGTKYGCGIGQCGACTVHLDGRAAKSCSISVEGAVGAAITTIEGLSSTGNHPVQEAWKAMDVPQCGYCQAGQIMTAAAFLQENPNPNREQIREALDGNLCRCAAYNRIEAAVAHAAQNKAS